MGVLQGEDDCFSEHLLSFSQSRHVIESERAVLHNGVQDSCLATDWCMGGEGKGGIGEGEREGVQLIHGKNKLVYNRTPAEST